MIRSVVNFGDEKLPPRFWAKCTPEPNSGCWLWFGARSEGYGVVKFGDRQQMAHRVSYTQLVGEIPEGLQIDHLCRVRCCVNPSHFEPVTRKENILRGTAPSALRAAQTLCKRGHALKTSKQGRRHCPTCHAAKQRRYTARKKEAA